MKKCEKCGTKPKIKRSETGKIYCSKCFSIEFENEVYDTIMKFNLIDDDDVVAVGVSGGKDSTALMHCLHAIQQRLKMNFRIELVCIDEGIVGYRNNALEAVQSNAASYGLPLTIISFTELFGWTLDAIFNQTQTKETCTYCGIFRRRALDLGANRVKATKVAVGHNAEDVSETILMNFMRGDIQRFQRNVDLKTTGIDESVPARIKPFAFQNQREIVFYAHFHHLVYYATECPYAVQAFRRFPRTYLVDKQKKDPLVMRKIIEAGMQFQKECEKQIQVEIKNCQKCGNPCNHELCMACKLLDRLEKGYPKKEVVEDNMDELQKE